MKDMRKISRGSGFSGVTNYLVFGSNKEKREYEGRLIGGNLSSTTPEDIAKEFGMSKDIRPDIKKPVWHNSLRLTKGEKLTDEKWVEIANDYMTKMGFTDKHQRIYVQHDDEDGQHIHIEASRIGLDGNVYLGRNENLKSTKVVEALESKYGLVRTKAAEYRDKKPVMPDRSKLKKEEIEKAIRTGEEPARLQLQKIIDSSLGGKTTVTQFVERLEAAGVKVKPNASSEKINGFAFELDSLTFSGSKLGNNYKYKKLEERGLTYDKATESSLIERLKAEARTSKGDDRATPADRASDHSNDESISSDSRSNAGGEAENAEAGQSVTAGTEESSAKNEDTASTDKSTQPAEKGKAKNTIDAVDLADNQPAGSGFDSSADLADTDIIKSGNKASNELAYSLKRARKKEEQESLARQREMHETPQITPVSHAQFASMLTALAGQLDYRQHSEQRKQERTEKRRFERVEAQVARHLPNLSTTMQENIATGKHDSHDPNFLKSIYEKIMVEQRTDPLRKTINEEINVRVIAERLAEIRLKPEHTYAALINTSYAVTDKEHAALIVSKAYAKTDADQYDAQKLREKLLELDVKTRREIDQEAEKRRQEAAQAQLEAQRQQDKQREKAKQKKKAGPERKRKSKHENGELVSPSI